MRGIQEFPLRGKKVVKRVDINSPLDENGEVVPNLRLEWHAESIRRLSEEGARVIVIAHQGRKGSADFSTLEGHARMLERIIGKQVEFVPGTDGEKARAMIGQMKDGDILLLENVRMWEGEEGTPEKSTLVKSLAPAADLFVLDALSVSHRPHASVTGLMEHLPSAAGHTLGRELRVLKNIGEGELTLILGGGKVQDSLRVMQNWLGKGKAKKVLLGGAVSVLFLDAAGHDTGGSHAYLEANGLLEYSKEARDMLTRYGESILLPVDAGLEIDGERSDAKVGEIERGNILDIGENTIERYSQEISNSKRILINGPMGVYEKRGFELGTRRILESISESGAFSLVGGGHTITAIKTLGIPGHKFSHISLSGKALIQYLSGKELPALKALYENRKSV